MVCPKGDHRQFMQSTLGDLNGRLAALEAMVSGTDAEPSSSTAYASRHRSTSLLSSTNDPNRKSALTANRFKKTTAAPGAAAGEQKQDGSSSSSSKKTDESSGGAQQQPLYLRIAAIESKLKSQSMIPTMSSIKSIQEKLKSLRQHHVELYPVSSSASARTSATGRTGGGGGSSSGATPTSTPASAAGPTAPQGELHAMREQALTIDPVVKQQRLATLIHYAQPSMLGRIGTMGQQIDVVVQKQREEGSAAPLKECVAKINSWKAPDGAQVQEVIERRAAQKAKAEELLLRFRNAKLKYAQHIQMVNLQMAQWHLELQEREHLKHLKKTQDGGSLKGENADGEFH